MESSRKRLGLIKGKLVKSLYRAAATTTAPKPSSAIQYGSSRVPNNQLDRPSIIHHLNHQNNHDQYQQPKQKLVPYNPNSTTASSFSSSSTGAVDFILNQEQVSIPQKPKVSFYIPPSAENTTDREYSNSTTATTYNYGKVENESVDLKAANYISSVQERFRLERINSERKAHYFSQSHEEVLQLHQ